MAKIRYRYNPDSLSYDKVTTSIKRTLIKAFTFFTATLAMAVVYYIIYSHFFDTPKERIQARELDQMEFFVTKVVNQRLDQMEVVLEDMQQRDDNIYRTVFEAEPIPQSVRQAGFGGVNRYESLEGYSNSDLMIETNKRIDKIAKQMYIQSKSYDELIDKAKNQEQMLLSRPAIQPVSNKDLKRTASGYGWRMHPIYKTMKFHDGMDFTAPTGTDIYATGDGEVTEVGVSGGYGNRIIVDHGFGYQTLYGHMDAFKVKVGDKVKRGQIIGLVGNTGVSSGPHLHYEVHKNGKVVNPVSYYYNDLTPEEYARILDLANVGKTFD